MTRLLSLSLLLVAAHTASALHFYMQSDERRCFLEELPNHTMVVGRYKAEDFNREEQKWYVNPEIGIQVQVEEVADSHVVVNTRGPAEGSFTFTSHEPGDHSICLSSNATSGWFEGAHALRVHLDIAVGNVKRDDSVDKDHINSLTTRIRDLNQKLDDIRKEQQFQREREVEFRNLSEQTNSRAIWWSLIQMAVLAATCYWQATHLRRFFSAKKLR